MRVDLRGIISGVWNSISGNKNARTIAIERMKVCNRCDGKLGTTNPTCRECGCFLKIKTLSMSDTTDCPRGKWLNKRDIRMIAEGKYDTVFMWRMGALKLAVPKYYYWLLCRRIARGKFDVLSKRVFHRTDVLVAYRPVQEFLKYMHDHKHKEYVDIVNCVKKWQ
jgi:ribosomal protein L40E